MRKIAIAIVTTVALLGTAPVIAKPKLTSQQELEKLIAGRVPGKPADCIPNFETRDMRILDKTAIVYGRGETIWVNVPRNASDLDDDDILVTHTSGSQFCRLDIVRTVDRGSHFPSGSISLGDFVPYRKAARTNSPH